MEINMPLYKLWLRSAVKPYDWEDRTTCTGGDDLPTKVGEQAAVLTFSKGEALSNSTYRITNNGGSKVFGLYSCVTGAQGTGSFNYVGPSDTAEVAEASTAATLVTNTSYFIDLQNSTPDTWTMSVYQTLPSSPGLKSLSWKQTTVPKNGESGVQWNINYLVGVANYKQSGGKGVYKASQKLGTSLGQKWACRFEDGAQQLFEDGGTSAGQVLIQNQSGDFANLGIGMDGDLALVQSDVYSGNNAQFEVTPTYWVALYKDVVQGEVISGNQVHGPIKVVFPSGVTQLTFEAYIDGKQFVFKEQGGTALVAPVEQVERRLRMLSAA
ncbi:hypothetical protein [Bradyrhizobium sp. ORS 285]|uniref:hypothetical protein n=1 Tax=Bradyrhizobium sp. ORS 285 TaxID=115808 RepID=UPI0018D5700D|nr:hypothetical protein [Bradyrhizobium sp. ORS 285]